MGINTAVIIASSVVTHSSIFVFTIMKKKIDTENTTTEERKRKIKFSKELKAAKSCFLVIVCCVTCCVPFLVVNSFASVQNNFTSVLLKRCFGVLVVLNSTLNSVIFFWRNKALRDEGKRLIKNMFRPRNVIHES